MAAKLQQKSAAAFFGENKAISGFDNPGKSLYTSIRELVENSLDAAEQIGAQPDIDIRIEEISKERFNRDYIGLANRERVDETLYGDYETEKAREKREEKERKAAAKQAAAAAAAADSDEEDAPKKVPGAKKASKAATYYKITVKDNGSGMPHDDIPNMLGIVLSGTKYGVKQTRGKFGLGAKMALIWAKMSTGLPIEVRSAQEDRRISHCILDIDIHHNKPNIIKHERLENPEHWRGTEMSVIIEGNWTAYRSRVLKYMRLMAVIAPYAQFAFAFEAEEAKRSFNVLYARRSEAVPKPPFSVKNHPSSVDLILVKQLIAKKPNLKLTQFLTDELSSINKALANKLVGELGLDPSSRVGDLEPKEINQLLQLFREAKFPPPDGKCLSPAGEYNLRLGIMKELQPEMVATHQSVVDVHEGNPFIIECGICMGGPLLKPGVTVFRFANRIPLLFESASDVATKTAVNFKWNLYKMRASQDKIGVFLSIVSTKIPFKGTSKEYIGDDSDAIRNAMKHALRQAAIQLKAKIHRKSELARRGERRNLMLGYVPSITMAVTGVYNLVETREKRSTGSRADEDDMPEEVRAAKRRRLAGPGEDFTPMENDIVHRFEQGQITGEAMKAKLVALIDRIVADEALAYAASTGQGDQERHDIHVAARLPEMRVHVLQAPSCRIRLFSSAMDIGSQ